MGVHLQLRKVDLVSLGHLICRVELQLQVGKHRLELEVNLAVEGHSDRLCDAELAFGVGGLVLIDRQREGHRLRVVALVDGVVRVVRIVGAEVVGQGALVPDKACWSDEDGSSALGGVAIIKNAPVVAGCLVVIDAEPLRSLPCEGSEVVAGKLGTARRTGGVVARIVGRNGDGRPLLFGSFGRYVRILGARESGQNSKQKYKLFHGHAVF